MEDGDWAVGRPHPALRSAVASYVGYTTAGAAPAVHAGLPSPYLTLILALDTPLRIREGAVEGGSADGVQAAVGGLHLEPVLIDQTRQQRGVHVSVDPLAARGLFAAPAAELSGTTVDLALLLPPARVRELTERAAAAVAWRDVFRLLDTALLAARRRSSAAAADPEVCRAWQLTRESGGLLPVQEAARRVGWSRRHLGARFRAALGVTPKQAARIVRFDRSGAALRGGAGPAAAAAEAGFADQAHLTREWNALAGATPAAWVRTELPFVQAAGEGPRHDRDYE
ncbi:helix-turn-helix domain-containing protein [Nocardiopsis coralliicola]